MHFSKKISTYFTLSIVLLFHLLSGNAYAKEIKLIFFYPGGEGSEAQAQPILDEFALALKDASEGKIEAKIRYFSDLKEGSSYIESEKPAGGILSYDLFLSQGPHWQAKSILQTLQLPSSNGKDQYFLIGNKESQLPASGEIKVLSSRPLSASFVKEKLFPDTSLDWNLIPTKNIVGKLRKLGMTNQPTENTWILLNQFEWSNLSRLRTAWVAGLKVMLESHQIPSAPFVLFDNALSDEEAQQLSKALTKMTKNPKAKKTLELLRIKGFASQ